MRPDTALSRRYVLLVLLFASLFSGCRSEVEYPPGVLVASAPVQQPPGDVPLLRQDDFVITPVARFEVEARVLSTKRYRGKREADLSPIDLALGWGPMSDQAVIDRLDISQKVRFYLWKAKGGLPIARSAIERNSANMHMIPANDDVREDLLKVRSGELVQFRGYLVNVRASDGWRWTTSTTRNDTGGGACELVWVEEIMSYEGPGAIR